MARVEPGTSQIQVRSVRTFVAHAQEGKASRTGNSVPSELPLGQDEAHECDVRRYAQRPEAEDDGCFRGSPGVTLERTAPVQR